MKVRHPFMQAVTLILICDLRKLLPCSQVPLVERCSLRALLTGQDTVVLVLNSGTDFVYDLEKMSEILIQMKKGV